ncbi:MAG: winged helix-turn-helix transcriptional regulator [Candidatus Aenigmatarchaeota archaeon]
MEQALELDVRRQIYDCIKGSPGIHFREIQRRTNIATGSLDYHLHFLHKHGLLRIEKEGGFTRYYALTKTWGQEEKDAISLLSQKKARHILIYLIQKKRASALKISEALKISPSSLSWYLKQLTEKNIIKQTKRGRFRFYRVAEPKKIIGYLIAYKTSFLDEVVDRFIEAWGE